MKRIDFYQLVDEAIKARENAYAPYSGFTVGAALLMADETVYTGCNIENAAYSPSMCAERVAFAKAVSDGYHNKGDFTAIAVVGAPKDKTPDTPCAPCGVCRQVMAEFSDPANFLVIMTGEDGIPEVHSLAELLPMSFTL